MIRNYAIIRESARAVADAAEATTADLRDEQVEQEPAFTDRMLGRISERMDGYATKGIIWKAKTLTDRGRNAQEAQYGADFMGVLEIDIPEMSVRKGFLAQAKLLEPSSAMPKREFTRMVEQCKAMLAVSPASFVFLYATSGIVVVPAVSIAALTSHRNPYELYTRKSQRFFENHFESFIGDPRLHIAKIETITDLANVADESRTRSALLLRAEREG